MIAYHCLLESSAGLGFSGSFTGEYSERIMLNVGKNQSDLHASSYEMPFHQNQGREVQLRSDNSMDKNRAGQRWVFYVKDVVSFFWRVGEKEITCFQHAFWTPQLCQYWLLHTLMPFYLTLEGTYSIFHAGAVEIEHKPVLFTAESYGGKSTLTDYFLGKGHPLIADDKVASFEQGGFFYSAPSFPYHRPYRRVEDLGFQARNFAKKCKPIHAIYELQRVEADSEVRISALSGVEKFKSLRHSSEINFHFMQKERFIYLARMANKIPVFRILVPGKIERLPEVYDSITKHMSDCAVLSAA